MSSLKIATILLSILLTTQRLFATQVADLPYSTTERCELSGSGPLIPSKKKTQNLSKITAAVNTAESRQCVSLFTNLTLKCLKIEGDLYCKGQKSSCPILWDVAVVNKMNERLFINQDERFRISLESDDFSGALTKNLRALCALGDSIAFKIKRTCPEDDSHALLPKSISIAPPTLTK